MIKEINSAQEISADFLVQTCCGRRILSYFNAYGTGYDFCRFFKSGESVVLIINSTMLICGETFDPEEINIFVDMHKPFRIEGNQRVIGMIKNGGYVSLHRTTFQLVSGENPVPEDEKDIDFSPRLDDVYSILNEGFPNLSDYPLWLADTSHRVRHGISRVMTYKSCTTASISYDINDFVLVSQVATRVSARGSGYARRFLIWLAGYLEKQGKTAVLYALDIRESFYREIGFRAVGEEFVLEKAKDNNENILKGKLQYND
ncbi:MAG: N-acetyltransferase [Oscillospiraceae bacterium]|nr:N-acetyltransferase [Oscillospiraceae bacterium]